MNAASEVQGLISKSQEYSVTPKHVARRLRSQGLGRRYDNPKIGRWLSRDPVGEDSQVNNYSFVENSPVSFCDPLGLTTFNIGFYGAGSINTWGNAVLRDEIAASINATLYSFWQGRTALRDLLSALDNNRDNTVDGCEAAGHIIRVFGYSSGGSSAINFAQSLHLPAGRTSKWLPSGYTLKSDIAVRLVMVLDPVTILNPASEPVPPNTEFFVNFFQKRGRPPVFRDPTGNRTRSMGSGAALFTGRSFSSDARVNVQIQIERDLPRVGVVAPSSIGSGFALYGADINHDFVPWFVKQYAVNWMQR